ncbi:uncharacterized protein EAE98_007170 [Botrytis deweyae]|uniref:Rab-GAP TBC domain-containing protein n=1 Tax=Botrytis deweyae TaxID=2478750 RepID=A0ABQ7II91_9HELO|nr:uncharacterized protein EAE98_007170 [Botrytis deweyae]KAF7925082.1 hypothetical protein EAE98_007170 [Botrytis deweyae]
MMMSRPLLTKKAWSDYECKSTLSANSHTLHGQFFLLQTPAFTESSYVSSPSQSFTNSILRFREESEYNWNKWEDSFVDINHDTVAMENDITGHLSRTASAASMRSQRSQTVRGKSRRLASQISSSASSISDKSLTSFPSFSGDSPTQERSHFILPTNDGIANRKASAAASIVDSLTTSSPSLHSRSALFDDAPLGSSQVPGSVHHANDEHIERLIARNGAVKLVRQIAEDLARRDAQMAALRRKAEERERSLRKIVLECGLSNLDLETRLRAIEGERKLSGAPAPPSESALEDLMNDAMSETVVAGELDSLENDATIRAKEPSPGKSNTGTSRGWKDYIWGGTSKTSRTTSRASSINGDVITNGATAHARSGGPGRRTILQNDIFHPPDAVSSLENLSRPPSSGSIAGNRQRKQSSLATLALKLVAGTATVRDPDGKTDRGRSNSAGTEQSGRTPSRTSTNSTTSARAVPKMNPRALRNPTPLTQNTTVAAQERWDTMGSSPQGSSTTIRENFGPVEMDTILAPEDQPPTLMQYRNYNNPDFLTDRFGFIYDQRRKKRQREAAERMRKGKRGSRVEMLSGGRSSTISAAVTEGGDIDDLRPGSPGSTATDDKVDDEDKPVKRWQDYLKIATFPTELLAHTPSGSMPAFEVMEGGEVPRSPGILTEERGFVPLATTSAPALSIASDTATISKPTPSTTSTPDPTPEDTEPVKLLLQQLGEVHDSLQRDKTVRWNDFLRKVRAERKREGEAAAAALALNTDSRSHRPIPVMPEASLADGEMIGVSGLGNKGKVGRAKWNEFKNLVLGGIPVAYRAKIWAECSGASAMRIPGYYDDLIARSEEDDDPVVVAQIQMDINRTLTDNIYFRKGPGVAKLNEVLLAYSRRNHEVGYCQGMNLITACLLLIMPTAEDAFWVLTSIIEHTLPPGYYDHSLLASRADQQVLRQYVSEILPRLSQHLDDLCIELEALTFQWFLSVFTDCLSAEALFRVWDVVLCMNDGSTFLFQVALALLKLNEQQLLQCSSPANVYTYINHQMTNHAISIDGLIHASEGLRKVVKRDEIEIRRARAIEAEKDLVKQREARNAARKAERAERAAALGSSPEISISSPTQDKDTGSDESAELTVRSPMPVNDDVD